MLVESRQPRHMFVLCPRNLHENVDSHANSEGDARVHTDTHTHTSWMSSLCVCVRVCVSLDQHLPQCHSRIHYITNERLSMMFALHAFLYVPVLIICLLPLWAAMDFLRGAGQLLWRAGGRLSARCRGLGARGLSICESIPCPATLPTRPDAPGQRLKSSCFINSPETTAA